VGWRFAKSAAHARRHDRRFGRNLVQTSRLPPELGRSLNRIHELRLTADYLAEPVPLDKARQVIEEAATFVAAIRKLME
jgi:uncharacterized protein (UPF0332 family)